MSSTLKDIVRQITPPIVDRLWSPRQSAKRYGYFGDYRSWSEARAGSAGYDTPLILAKVRRSLEQVRDGKAAYERDSVLFDQVQHSFPLLAGLLRAASHNGNRLSVLDLGGSLGSTYFACRDFLAPLTELRWSIVEQPAFVVCGQQHFQSEQLRFYADIDACMREQRIDLILLSSVLPYVEKPHDLLRGLTQRGVRHLILDRTPILEGDLPDRLTVQRVSPSIYGQEVSYPAWFFNRRGLLADVPGPYELIAEFDALAGRIDLGDAAAVDKGFIFSAS